MKGQELARELERLVNNFNTNEQNEFIKGFLTMHPTLMQSTFRLMLRCVEAMANKPYVDGRNQASKEAAQLIIEGYKLAMKEKLMGEKPDYWTDERAEEYVNSDFFEFSNLPLI